MPDHGQTWPQGDAVLCAGSALIIEETDPADGSVLRARLGEFSAERSGNKATVRRGNEVLLTFEVPEDATTNPDVAALVGAVKTLKDLCVINPRDQKTFATLAELTVLPTLKAAGVLLGNNFC